MPQRVQPTRVKKTRLQVASGQALRQVGSQSWTPAGELGCEPKPQLSTATTDKGQLSRFWTSTKQTRVQSKPIPEGTCQG